MEARGKLQQRSVVLVSVQICSRTHIKATHCRLSLVVCCADTSNSTLFRSMVAFHSAEWANVAGIQCYRYGTFEHVVRNPVFWMGSLAVPLLAVMIDMFKASRLSQGFGLREHRGMNQMLRGAGGRASEKQGSKRVTEQLTVSMQTP